MTIQAHSIPYENVFPPPKSFAGLSEDAGVSVSSLAPGFSEKKQESNSLEYSSGKSQ